LWVCLCHGRQHDADDLGDAQAALVGRRYGYHRYTVLAGRARWRARWQCCCGAGSYVAGLAIVPLAFGMPSVSPLLVLIYGGRCRSSVRSSRPCRRGHRQPDGPLAAMLVLFALKV